MSAGGPGRLRGRIHRDWEGRLRRLPPPTMPPPRGRRSAPHLRGTVQPASAVSVRSDRQPCALASARAEPTDLRGYGQHCSGCPRREVPRSTHGCRRPARIVRGRSHDGERVLPRRLAALVQLEQATQRTAAETITETALMVESRSPSSRHLCSTAGGGLPWQIQLSVEPVCPGSSVVGGREVRG